PPGLPGNKWLSFYISKFGTVELNYSFYRLPGEAVVRSWKGQTPKDFLWSVKASRYITHIKRLKDAAGPVKLFLGRLSKLAGRSGPVLFQLPPNLPFNAKLLEDFLAALPKKHRYTLEVRHPSWICRECMRSLREHNIAFCISDTAGKFPYLEEITADFIYIRLHGHKKLYRSLYTAGEMKEWADKIAGWKKDAYVYFDNTMGCNAVKNALQLKKLLK
ncbi:unnamed protein product, partial [marine sediment metagenome]